MEMANYIIYENYNMGFVYDAIFFWQLSYICNNSKCSILKDKQICHKMYQKINDDVINETLKCMWIPIVYMSK